MAVPYNDYAKVNQITPSSRLMRLWNFVSAYPPFSWLMTPYHPNWVSLREKLDSKKDWLQFITDNKDFFQKHFDFKNLPVTTPPSGSTAQISSALEEPDKYKGDYTPSSLEAFIKSDENSLEDKIKLIKNLLEKGRKYQRTAFELIKMLDLNPEDCEPHFFKDNINLAHKYWQFAIDRLESEFIRELKATCQSLCDNPNVDIKTKRTYGAYNYWRIQMGNRECTPRIFTDEIKSYQIKLANYPSLLALLNKMLIIITVLKRPEFIERRNYRDYQLQQIARLTEEKANIRRLVSNQIITPEEAKKRLQPLNEEEDKIAMKLGGA